MFLRIFFVALLLTVTLKYLDFLAFAVILGALTIVGALEILIVEVVLHGEYLS